MGALIPKLLTTFKFFFLPPSFRVNYCHLELAEHEPACAGSSLGMELREAHREDQVLSELHSSWAIDDSVWVRKKSPPQMAIYKTLYNNL